MVVGNCAELGEWEPRQGLWMSCRPCPREPEEILWEASAVVTYPGGPGGPGVSRAETEDPSVAERGDKGYILKYSYIVVDDTVQVLRREVRVRTLLIVPEFIARGLQTEPSSPNNSGNGGGADRGQGDDVYNIEVDACDWWDAEADTETISRCATFRSACLPVVGDTEEAISEAPRQPQAASDACDVVQVRFCVRQYGLPRDHRMILTGCSFSHAPDVPIPMHQSAYAGASWWEVELAIDRSAFPIDYRYCIARDDGDRSTVGVVHEGEMLRGYSDMSRSRDRPSMIVINDGLFAPIAQRPSAVEADFSPSWRGFGIAAPVFSLRTERSIGCGDFRDLRSLIDFTHKCNGSVVQILPVNDTGVNGSWRDSYPYSSRSVFALHPLYLVVDELLVEESLPSAIKERADALRASLDELSDMDYEKALDAKLALAQMAFDHVGGASALSTVHGLENFVDSNSRWLRPYAAFCFLQEVTGTSEHTTWGMWSTATPELIHRITSREALHFRSIAFTYFVQFALHRQLLETSQYAAELGVALKGDLPIGVDKRSVDTWQSPELFRMNTSTGAPPDYFDGLGQNWGFPTYVWENMAKDNYKWWTSRIRRMECYFHAYRIDHILGFFRIWELPSSSVNGMLGNFRPSVPYTVAELHARGVYDIDRLSRPYIRWHDLVDRFGERAAEVVTAYFAEDGDGRFMFKDEVATERALVDSCTRTGEDSDTTRQLLNLIQNVCLIRSASDDRYFPRVLLEQTVNFRELDAVAQDALLRLADDFYHHRHEIIWRNHALEVLPALQRASGMLVCGEDLGMIPACVNPVLSELGILKLCIQRMPAVEGDLGDPSQNPYESVCTTSSHDVPNLRAWLLQPSNVELLRGKFPDREPSQMSVVKDHLDSPSCLCILPIQDVIQMLPKYCMRDVADEIINDPTNSTHYWKYRMENRIDTQLCKDSELIELVRGMVEQSGRVVRASQMSVADAANTSSN